MRTRVLLLPIVFLRVRCNILILLIETVRCSIVRCKIPHCIYVYISDITPYLYKTSTWPYQEICIENKRAFSDVVSSVASHLRCLFSVPGPSVSICCGKSGTRTGVSPNASVLPYRSHFINASCSFFQPAPTL